MLGARCLLGWGPPLPSLWLRPDPIDQEPQPGLYPQTDHLWLVWNLELGSPQCPSNLLFRSPHFYLLGSVVPCPPSCGHSLNHGLQKDPMETHTLSPLC